MSRNPLPRPLRVIRKRLRNFFPREMEPVAPGLPPPDPTLPLHERLTGLERLLHSTFAEISEIKLILAAHTRPPTSIWQNKPVPVEGAPGAAVFSTSTICRQDSFEQPYFAYWAQRIGQGLRYHRKLWEFVFILQALWERGAVRPGARGLGFGVGSEPLAAFFASQGVMITATDMAPDDAAEAGWVETNQHAASKAALAYPTICPPELFETNVEFRPCDMNAIPDDMTGYDFCWSACAFEHLGSIEAGLTFVERSLDTLKPGGWAIHTTEYNMGSNDRTVEHGGTVLFRKRDFEELARRLTEKGHHVAPFDLTPGEGPVDRYLDIAPYRAEPHVVLALWGHQTTSIGVIVQKAGG
ncbi:MAG: class I SAM-dependent methyltransferase [Caulobacterales bacterium]|nr:class I SAM-dependent methyltransferase [Caulobacterales bacterium]